MFKKRKRSSKIWFVKTEILRKLIKGSSSLHSVLKKIGVASPTGNYIRLKQRLKEEGIDYSHITLGINSTKGKKIISNRKKKKLKYLLVKNSNCSRGYLKRRLLKEKVLEEKCVICGLLPYWNNKKLMLILDHENGIYNDHRLKNLRLLCPNCNSQTKTFAGRNVKKKKKICLCIQCKQPHAKYTKYGLCFKCYLKLDDKNNGFLGKHHTIETRKQLSKTHKGKNNSQYNTKWITNGKEVKKVKKEDLDKYLENGWSLGIKLQRRIIGNPQVSET